MSDMSSFAPSIRSSGSKWPATLSHPVAVSWRLVAFLFWRRLMTFSSSELSIRSLSLLLNIFDNNTTSSYNFSFCPNACFNPCFWSIVRIFLFLSARFPAQVSIKGGSVYNYASFLGCSAWLNQILSLRDHVRSNDLSKGEIKWMEVTYRGHVWR